jgi:hypothetical protein
MEQISKDTAHSGCSIDCRSSRGAKRKLEGLFNNEISLSLSLSL